MYIAGSMGATQSPLAIQPGTYMLRVDITGLDVVAVLSGPVQTTVMTTLTDQAAPGSLELNASGAVVAFAYVEQVVEGQP